MSDYDSIIENIKEYDRMEKVVLEEANKIPDHWYIMESLGSKFPFFNEIDTARQFQDMIQHSLEYRNRVFELSQQLVEDYEIPTDVFIAHHDIWYKLAETDHSDKKAFYSVKRKRKS